MFKRIKCWLIGHRWQQIVSGYRHDPLGNVTAIVDYYCPRCAHYKNGKIHLKRKANQ